MSAASECEPTARQDYGPPSPSEHVYENDSNDKVAGTMNVQSIRTPVLRAVPTSPTQGDPQPDSTNHETIIHTLSKADKEVEFHIAEKSNADMSLDTLTNIVRIEDSNCTLDDVGRIAYPILQEVEDSNEDNYVENSATLIQGPLSAAFVQNVTKLPQNFTINMEGGAVSNITTIQNVSQEVSGASTLWLPTILAAGAPLSDKGDEERSQPPVSQIIITSDGYDTAQLCRRSNITETGYISRPKNSKVQILSNIALPKTSAYSTQYVGQSKDVTGPMYATQNHIYKLGASVASHKHTNNSVLCGKPARSQAASSALTPSVINTSPVKSLAYAHTFTKSTNFTKSLNKVNNGATLSAAAGTTQCHVLSRVVSAPNKLSVHSGRKAAVKGSKSGQAAQKSQTRPIKIIQQAGGKPEPRCWPLTGLAYKSRQAAEAAPPKVIQRVGSPAAKAGAERLVLQSPCGPVLLSPAPPRYLQYGETPHLSANQQLTAQILHSLSQPKLVLQAPALPAPTPAPAPALTLRADDHKPMETQQNQQRRIVMGDKSTLLTAVTAEDLIGTEERPNLSEELRRYTYQPLALVMLDHTYALPAQKQPSPTQSPAARAASPAPSSPAPLPQPARASPPPPTAPPAPRTSPVIVPNAGYEPPPPTVVCAPSAGPAPALVARPAPEDDAASVASSLDAERRAPDGGSDTETAPEGEDEGKTRCVCDYTHDDGYMICCDRCAEWQHVDCMGIDRQNIPDSYMCELCLPRPVDRRHARAIQSRKREELSALGASDSDSSGAGRPRRRLLTVTTYSDSGAPPPVYAPPPPPRPAPPPPPPRRGPNKRPVKKDLVRKGSKRKLSEKRARRKKEMLAGRGRRGASPAGRAHCHDAYESAVTNHYSPELRARVARHGGAGPPGAALALAAHRCTTVPHAGGKILIATEDLREGTPIVELRGKYMLAAQLRPPPPGAARASALKPGPFVFFYRLPRDDTRVCIDTRTYGNEARFVRRSCRANAELQHCVVKGALHVFLVSTAVVPADTEITVPHDADGARLPCACGNPRHCPLEPRERRARAYSASSPASPPPAPALTTPRAALPRPHRTPVKHEFPPLSPAKPLLMSFFEEPTKAEIFEERKPEMDLTAKEEMKPENDLDEPDFYKVEKKEELKEEVKEEPPPVKSEPEEEPDAPGRAPPDVAALPNKLQERRRSRYTSETKFATETKYTAADIRAILSKEEMFSDDEKSEPTEKEEITKDKEKGREDKEKASEDKKIEEDKPLSLLSKDVTAKSACHDRSSRSSRNCTNHDSLDDKTDDSQDKIQTPTCKEKRKMTREERKMEAIMKAFERMEKAQQRKQEVKERQKRRESDPHPNAADKDDDEEIHCPTKRRRRRKGRARTTSQCNRRRLNSADSDMVTSGDEAPPPADTPPRAAPPPPSHSETNSHNDSVSEDLGLSPACLLVEAAVGSVESAFKLPKTKKTMATEWVGRSPERTPSPYRSPFAPALVAPSLESLVRVASTMIGDLSGHTGSEPYDEPRSPPRTPARDRNRPPKKARRVTRSTPPAEVPEATQQTLPQHSAKKRWLRQAISEESDPPAAESPPNEMITPLKKRRLARESLSLEPSAAPAPLCRTPSPAPCVSEDSPGKNSQTYTSGTFVEGEYARDRTRSDSGQGSDDQGLAEHDALNVPLAGPHDTDHIRRIIGVPTPPPAACASADTSAGSSPQPDDMDDIQKKIHSFHTENIMMLESRNKKPKEKRKKVNLNFDLSMVDDRVSIQLRTEPCTVAPENIPLPPVESIPLPAEPAPPPECIPLPAAPAPAPPGLFAGIFSDIAQRLGGGTAPAPAPAPPPPCAVLERPASTDDDMRSVREILSRVNSMDSRNSVLLSGVLRATPAPTPALAPASAPRPVPRADPRRHAPQQDKPKPVRRKLSISEYRKRKGAPTEEGGECERASPERGSPESSHALSPQRLDAAAHAAALELEHRLHKELATDHLPKGVFDAQPTASERQREDQSSRLRREFGLAPPAGEEPAQATHATPTS